MWRMCADVCCASAERGEAAAGAAAQVCGACVLMCAVQVQNEVKLLLELLPKYVAHVC